MSLNQFITNALTAAVGWQATDDQQETGAPARPRSPAPRWLRVAIVVNLVVLAIAVVLAAILLIAAWQDW